MFYLKEDHLHIDPDKKILKADEYALYLEAEEIITKAKEKAARIIQESKQVFEDEKKRGFKEGMDEGNKKVSEVLIETVDKTVKNFEHFENEIIDIVDKALKKILGKIDEKDLIVRVVKNALEAVRNQKKVTLFVAANDATLIRDQLDEILSEFPGINYIDIEVDQRLSPGGCRLETEIGVVDATLEVQLEAIKKSLTKMIK